MAPPVRRSGRKRTLVNGDEKAEGDSVLKLPRQKKAAGDQTKQKKAAGDQTNAKVHCKAIEKPFIESKENIAHQATIIVVPDALSVRQRLQPTLPGFNPYGLHSNNLIYRLKHNTLGITPERNLRQAVVQSYVEQLTNYRILTTASPFDRRVTAMQWHPTLPSTIAVGSKGGDLILWDFAKTEGIKFVKGIGKGGSITNLQIDASDPSYVYTSSNDGMVRRQSFHDDSKTIFLNTGDWDYWYSSLDVNYKSNVLVAGDSKGNTVLMTRQGEKVWSHRLHKQKVTHCEFNKKCEWLLVTASTDKVVKLWDIRKVSGRSSALYQLPHDKPINSAYFSPDCTRLLTTDQCDEIRLYSGPLWDKMERSIAHPHRFFQHISPIKATWHPVHDLIVCGRYPDPQFPGYHPGENRTIDLFDANTGDMVCQLLDGSVKGIVSVCQFNQDGNYLATGMGYNTLVWANVNKLFQNGTSTKGISTSGLNPNRGSNTTRRRPNRRNNDDDDIGKMKKKIKTKTKTQTKSKTKTTKSGK